MNGTAPLLLHVFPAFAVGGQQTRFTALAAALGSRYRHVVLAMNGDFSSAVRLPPEIAVRCEGVAITRGATVSNIRRLRQSLRRIAPDLLVTYNWGTIEWAIANVPRLVRHIHVEDGFGPEEASRQLPRRVLTRRLVLARSTVVVPSHTLWRTAIEVWKLGPQRVRYIPNGVDLARFAGPRATGPEPVVGTVTALRAEKNLPRLLHAFRRVADVMPAQLMIVGDGPERSNLEALARQLALTERLRLTGHIHEPAALYRAIDVFALSSDTEQMPLSILEAMASGLPVAATDVGDVSAMLAQENRDFVTAPDAIALAGAMMALLRDPQLRSLVGAANRAKAATEFSEASMVAAWAALFDTTVVR